MVVVKGATLSSCAWARRQAMSARACGERVLVLSRISCSVGRIEEALRLRSSLSDFCILPYFSFQEWYAWRTGRCSSER